MPRSFSKENRQIRIFLSSSFEGMEEERDYLRDLFFNELQEKARRHYVALTVLDLRWGIPQDASLSETIETCMQEIDNSYPFFIGLLGGYYGTTPDKTSVYDKSDILKEQFTILKKYFEKQLSITDMEMRYGVLDCPKEEQKQLDALFFIRKKDISIIETKEKLKDLWSDIKNSCLPYEDELIKNNKEPRIWRSEYDNFEELKTRICSVFDALLERIFPLNDLKDELSHERARQKASLYDLKRFYIPNDKYLDKINLFVSDNNSRLLNIYGNSGTGKSSLIAYWISQNEERLKEKGINIIYHFVGGGSGDCNTTAIISRICKEIMTLYKKNLDRSDKLNFRSIFHHIFDNNHTRDQKRLVIIIDAINQLDTSVTHELIPYSIPSQVQFIYSSIEQIKTNKNQLCDYLPVSDIKEVSLRKQIIEDYIHSFHRKRLTEKNISSIVSWPLSCNPLSLKTLLNELIVTGKYDQIDDIIFHYTQLSSINDLFLDILNRFESDKRYSWIPDAFIFIFLSLYGLSENELLQILNVPQLYWSHFYCYFRRQFIVKNGLITISHQYLYDSIKSKYIDQTKNTDNYHERLIPLFIKKETTRELEELFVHCMATRKYNEILYSSLSTPHYFYHLWKKDYFSLIKAFSHLLDNGFSLPDLSISYEDLSCFLEDNGYFGDYGKDVLYLYSCFKSETLFQKMFNSLNRYFHEDGLTRMEYIPAYLTAGDFYREQGNYRQAIRIYKRGFWASHPGGLSSLGYSENDDNEYFYEEIWHKFFYGIGECYRCIGDYENALKYLEKALSVERETETKENILANIYWSLCQTYQEIGNSILSSKYLNYCFQKDKDIKGHISIWVDIYIASNKPDTAYKTIHRELKKHIKQLSSNHVLIGIDYYEIGKCLYHKGLTELAVKCLHKSIKILENKDSSLLQIANGYALLGLCLYAMGKYEDSLCYYNNASDLYKKMNNIPLYLETERDKSVILSYLGQYTEGEKTIQAVIDLSKETNSCSKYRTAYYNEILSFFQKKTGNYHNCFNNAVQALNELLPCLGPENSTVINLWERIHYCVKMDTKLKTAINIATLNGPILPFDKILIIQESTTDDTLILRIAADPKTNNPAILRTIVYLIRLGVGKEVLDNLLTEIDEFSFLMSSINIIEKHINKSFLKDLLTYLILTSSGLSLNQIKRSYNKYHIADSFEPVMSFCHCICQTTDEQRFVLPEKIWKTVVVNLYYPYKQSDIKLYHIHDFIHSACVFPYRCLTLKPVLIIDRIKIVRNIRIIKRCVRHIVQTSYNMGKNSKDYTPYLKKILFVMNSYHIEKDDISMRINELYLTYLLHQDERVVLGEVAKQMSTYNGYNRLSKETKEIISLYNTK